MNRWIVLALAGTVAALGSPFANPPVDLQPSTPGTKQTGHVNISGTLLAGTIAATSASAYAISGKNTGASGVTYGGLFESDSNNGRAIFGTAAATSGFNFGGYFRSLSTDGRGVYGEATSTSGTNYGGYFRGSGSTAIGVFGTATSPTGANFGGYFRTTSTTGRGVYGFAVASDGVAAGGEFKSSSTSGIGVLAESTPATGITYAGMFQNSSSQGTGVRSDVFSTTGTTYGGYFASASTTGYGSYGYASSSSGPNFGVLGATNSVADGYGLYSLGRSGSSGTKSFRIDHPMDPENKYLVHYSAEGPEPLLVYSGNIVTDSRGYAWVQLPNYFEDINRDFRYQLTVVSGGADFVQAMVSKEISNNRFQVRTSKPSVKVCWEVKGVRNDRFVRTYGAPVEVDKPDSEKGTYQHPELYGQPKERGLMYLRDNSNVLNVGAPPANAR